MSANSFQYQDEQPPVFGKHAEKRYQERTPDKNPIPIHDAYHRSLRASIEDDCEARVYLDYDIIFVKRGAVIKTELVADYSRMIIPDAMWCDNCDKPFRPDVRCKWCNEPVQASQTNGAISLIQKGGK